MQKMQGRATRTEVVELVSTAELPTMNLSIAGIHQSTAIHMVLANIHIGTATRKLPAIAIPLLEQTEWVVQILSTSRYHRQNDGGRLHKLKLK